MLTFQDVSALLKASENPMFNSLIASIHCLVTIVETIYDEDILILFEIMDRIRVEKYLFIDTPQFDYNLLQNRTINYKVFISHQNKGT